MAHGYISGYINHCLQGNIQREKAIKGVIISDRTYRNTCYGYV